jgi:hypothetical protein
MGIDDVRSRASVRCRNPRERRPSSNRSGRRKSGQCHQMSRDGRRPRVDELGTHIAIHTTSTLLGSGGMERAILGGQRAADRVLRSAAVDVAN